MKRLVSISLGELQSMYGEERAIEIAAEIGADAVDFDTCSAKYDYRNPDSVYSKSDEEIVAHYTKLREKAESLGIFVCQTHGRITGFRNDKAEDDALIENARIDCLVAKTLGAPICVIHSVTSIYMGPDADRKLMHDLNFDMFNRILVHAKTYGIKIASETFGDAVRFSACDFFGNIDEFLMSYNRVAAVGDNAKYFCVCADTGHSNKAMRFNNPTPGNVIRMLGGNVQVLHLNDNDTLTDQHKAPMTGCIDWKDVFDALDEIGYNGIYNMELSLVHFGKGFAIEYAAFSVKLLKFLLKERYGE